jgi:hypothetical protein
MPHSNFFRGPIPEHPTPASRLGLSRHTPLQP